jgi:hypothetical protein
MSSHAPDPTASEHRRLPLWFKAVLATVALTVLILVVIEPGCLCSAPFVGLFLATMISTLRAKGGLRMCGVGFSVLTGVVVITTLLNVLAVGAASRPIRAAGGTVHTAGEDINFIFGPSAVTWVDFTGPAFTDADLERMVPSLRRFPDLAVIALTNTRVTDAGLKNLYGLKSLKVVWVDGTPVTSDGTAELKRALPGLKVVE